jgi:class 3 adenylate cyclase
MIFYFFIISKVEKNYCIGLNFIYIKHVVDLLITPNITIRQYELSRALMWVFTTPIMLKMYCDINYLTLKNINFKYHVISIVPYIFVAPLKNSIIYTSSMLLLTIPEIIFIRSLYKYKEKPFTNMFIILWVIFMFINVLELSGLVNIFYISAFYNIADTLLKIICNVVLSIHNDEEITIHENMDLQSVNFISHIIKSIKQYEHQNKNMSLFCSDFINQYKKNCLNKIPKTDSRLKLELLKKILPFDFDKDYIKTKSDYLNNSEEVFESNTNIKYINSNADLLGINNLTQYDINEGKNKEFQMICIMFIDIVNYTELAKKYDGNTIFKLLNNVYNKFDNIIKKYKHLQKIETIGDAYMVVGDLFRNELNHKEVVKEIIYLALKFIKEIKNIETPDSIPLCIRIGINMGTVNVGILGNEIPRLCVVGNAVNVANRLQSTADSDTIQISRHIYEQSKDIDFGFKIEYTEKENVFLKNIGSVTTFVITPS